MNHWPKIDLWHLAQMKVDLGGLCDILSCSQVARVLAVISHSDGHASLRKYCSEHERKGLAKLQRDHPGVEPIDHRGPTAHPGSNN
jgi:hypothetical protein